MKRYNVADIVRYTKDVKSTVAGFSVEDTFGSYGITGLCILNLEEGTSQAKIDTFLMSCRVIGRNIERVMLEYLVSFLRNKAVKSVVTDYVRTNKNELMEKFLEETGFVLNVQSSNAESYFLDLVNVTRESIDSIEVEELVK